MLFCSWMSICKHLYDLRNLPPLLILKAWCFHYYNCHPSHLCFWWYELSKNGNFWIINAYCSNEFPLTNTPLPYILNLQALSPSGYQETNDKYKVTFSEIVLQPILSNVTYFPDSIAIVIWFVYKFNIYSLKFSLIIWLGFGAGIPVIKVTETCVSDIPGSFKLSMSAISWIKWFSGITDNYMIRRVFLF